MTQWQGQGTQQYPQRWEGVGVLSVGPGGGSGGDLAGEAGGGRRGPRGITWLAWIVIVGICGFLFVSPMVMPEEGEGESNPDDPLGLVLFRLQGMYMVGAASLESGSGGMVYGQAETTLNKGSVGQRQRFVILAAELVGLREAAEQRELLEFDIEAQKANSGLATPFELTAEQERVQGILRTLYDASALSAIEEGGDESADDETDATRQATAGASGDSSDDASIVVPTDATPDVADAAAEPPAPETIAALANIEKLSDDDATFLCDKLGWFGELALVPAGTDLPRARESTLEPAQMVVFVFVGVVIVLCAVGFLGFVGLVMLLIFAAVGRVRSRVLASATHHGIYAETFAVWLAVFFGCQLVAGLVSAAAGLSTAASMGLVIVGFAWSLAALAWPVIRGVPWAQVRADIGWTLGRGIVVEKAVGVAGYAMALPLLGIGLLLTLLFMLIEQMFTPEGVGRMFEPMGGPAHPIVLEVAGPDVLPKVMILLLAAVAAPIVEETMFRGVLYRHLRDVSRRLGPVISVLFSGMVSGFLFAAIHPQGWVAIPALMSLAWAFVILREWRGSVVPAMVVHGISNGLVMTLLMVLLGLG